MRSLYIFSTFLLILGVIGCASMTQPQAQVDINAGAQALPPYSGPKARVAVADFDVKAAKAYGAIGPGLREMLVTALISSNRFSVVERQALGAVMQEQELAASGAAQPGLQRGQIKTADIVISAAVTEFEPYASGGGIGVGGFGGVGSGILGGLIGGSMKKAHMALDLRIIDTSTSEILASTRVQGSATDVAGGIATGFFGGGWGLGTGLGGYANTPTEKAIRICIIEAVRYICQAIPAPYYKY